MFLINHSRKTLTSMSGGLLWSLVFTLTVMSRESSTETSYSPQGMFVTRLMHVFLCVCVCGGGGGGGGEGMMMKELYYTYNLFLW